MQKAEMMRLVKLIATSPNISQHDKYLVHKEQEGWEHDLPGICGTDPYCTNSELQHHINDLSAYLTSFSK